MKARNIPFIVSCLLLAAHFLRINAFIPVLICLLIPLMLFIRIKIIPILLQILSIGACLIWLYTLWGIIQERIIQNRSWVPSAIILGTVIIFTLWSAYLLTSLGKIKNTKEFPKE
ncbi:MAG: hypothetical protein WCP19_03460 [Chloroflexota bacterium]